MFFLSSVIACVIVLTVGKISTYSYIVCFYFDSNHIQQYILFIYNILLFVIVLGLLGQDSIPDYLAGYHRFPLP